MPTVTNQDIVNMYNTALTKAAREEAPLVPPPPVVPASPITSVPWHPEEDEIVCFLFANGSIEHQRYSSDNNLHTDRLLQGFIFKTRSEADAYKKWLCLHKKVMDTTDPFVVNGINYTLIWASIEDKVDYSSQNTIVISRCYWNKKDKARWVADNILKEDAKFYLTYGVRGA